MSLAELRIRTAALYGSDIRRTLVKNDETIADTESRHVTVERHGAVMLLRLNRPTRANAIGGTLLRDLASAFDEAGEDDDVHVVVTTGNGKTFCVGADVEDLDKIAHLPARLLLASSAVGGEKGLKTLSPRNRDVDDLGNAGRVAQRLWSLDKPTIAAINGAAVGGGLAIAMLHDIRLASETARIGTGFAALGIAPELAITYVLPRVVGAAAAADLLFRAELLSGTAARDIGLVSEAVPAEQLLDRAMAIAAQIAEKPSLATRWAKRLLRHSAGLELTAQLRAEYTAQVSLFDHPDTRAALAETVQRLSKGRA
jgi:enoyl-CoA hydratase/carnithine racemase